MSQALDWGLAESGPQTPVAYSVQGNDSFNALLSGHLGSSRPAYAEQGTFWNKDTGSSPLLIERYFFDGTDDILVATFDVSANTVVFAGLEIGVDVSAFNATAAARSINAQTGTAYTLVLADGGGSGNSGKLITMTNAAANELTIPPNSSVAFPVGTQIDIKMNGAGITSITGDTGVTLNGVSTGTGAIDAQYKAVTIIKEATNTWGMVGAHGAVA